MNQPVQVSVDTHVGWKDVYSSRSKKEREVVTVLINEIIPWFGDPHNFQSDDGLFSCSDLRARHLQSS